MNDKEFESLKCLEMKWKRGDQIIQTFCRIGSHQETRSALFNLMKFQKIEKSKGESIATHSSAKNDEEFDSVKFQELKYRRGGPNNQAFCRIGCSQEIRSPLFNFKKFRKLKKVLVNQLEPIEVQ